MWYRTSKERLARTTRWLLIPLGLALSALFAPPSPVGPTTARAVIGRPLTPMSYAGVARRTTRRAVAYGGYYPYRY